MIKLGNGKEVTLEEFVTWNAIKQEKHLRTPADRAITRAKLAITIAKKTPEEIAKVSERMKATWAKRRLANTPEMTAIRSARAKKAYANKTPEQKAAFSAKMILANAKRTQETKEIAKAKHRNTWALKRTAKVHKLINTPVGVIESFDAAVIKLGVSRSHLYKQLRISPKEYYYVHQTTGTKKRPNSNITPEEKAAISAKKRLAHKKRTPEEKAAISAKLRLAHKKRTPDEIAEISAKRRLAYIGKTPKQKAAIVAKRVAAFADRAAFFAIMSRTNT